MNKILKRCLKQHIWVPYSGSPIKCSAKTQWHHKDFFFSPYVNYSLWWSKYIWTWQTNPLQKSTEPSNFSGKASLSVCYESGWKDQMYSSEWGVHLLTKVCWVVPGSSLVINFGKWMLLEAVSSTNLKHQAKIWIKETGKEVQTHNAVQLANRQMGNPNNYVILWSQT